MYENALSYAPGIINKGLFTLLNFDLLLLILYKVKI